MGERYYITGTQLGILMSIADNIKKMSPQDQEKLTETAKNIVNDIEEKQFLGGVEEVDMIKKGRGKLQTFAELECVQNLCVFIDEEVYLPVKQELEGIDRTYSLGMKKENYKGLIQQEFWRIRNMAIKWVKQDTSKNPHIIKMKNKKMIEFFNITKKELE